MISEAKKNLQIKRKSVKGRSREQDLPTKWKNIKNDYFKIFSKTKVF